MFVDRFSHAIGYDKVNEHVQGKQRCYIQMVRGDERRQDVMNEFLLWHAMASDANKGSQKVACETNNASIHWLLKTSNGWRGDTRH